MTNNRLRESFPNEDQFLQPTQGRERDMDGNQAGNSSAAGEIYGLGVRIGIYLQVFAMALSNIRMIRKGSKKAGRLSAFMFALLSSWTILVRRKSLSPCEAWLVLSLIYGVGLDLPEITGGEGIATVMSIICGLWLAISGIWFWGRLCWELPDLGTRNLVFMFRPVEVTGWFRRFLLVATDASIPYFH